MCISVEMKIRKILNEIIDLCMKCLFLIQQLPFQRKTGKPFVCGISGQCKSIGLELALMCDIRYVEQKAVLGFNNRKLGIPLLNGGPKRLANIIGTSKAIDFIGMDRQVNADEAVELGLANGVVQDGTGIVNAIFQ